MPVCAGMTNSGLIPVEVRIDMLEQTQSLKKYFLIYVLLIIIFTVIPIGHSHQLENKFIINFRLDHILHALEFIPWAFFCMMLGRNTWFCFALGILFAVGTEVLQCAIPYRSFNINDMIANIIGIGIGFFVFMIFAKEKE